MPEQRSRRCARRPIGVLMLATCVALAAACGGDSTAPSSSDSTATKPENDLHFVQPSDSAPRLAQRSLTFYAVRGQDREVRLYYQPRPGRTDSTEFLRFRVRSGSLVKRPDGTPMAEGDSLPITITVADTTRLIVQFEPSGLTFASTDPARLTLKYAEADDDLNDDGHVDATDLAAKAMLGIWRQESPGAPWILLPSSVSLVISDEVEADVPGFTSYAIAY